MKKIILLLFPLLIYSCEAMLGKEVARIPVNKISSKNDIQPAQVSLELKKGDELFIWSEMDFEYEGDVKLVFQFMIFKDDSYKGGMEFDPTEKNISIKEVKTSIMGKTKWKFSGKNKNLAIEEDGNYTFKAVLITSENESLILNKAEIVLKQKKK